MKKLSVKLGKYGRWPIYFSFKLTERLIKTHRHVLGISGSGKSKMLANMTSELILQGVACCLIDPHSDLADDVLAILYDRGFFNRPGADQKLLYIDFSRTDRFIPFNVLKQPYDVHEVARNLVEVCTRAWSALADGAAPLFENIMLASVPILIQNNLPITALDDLLSNKPYRDKLLENCSDPKISSFFHNQFDAWGKEQPAMIGSALRRAFLLAYTPALRFTLGQKENILNFRELMDSNTSVIVNLGGLDEQTQKILGCLFTVGFENASLSREDIPENKRSLYNLILDEFSMFSAQSEEALSRVLSLARKYNLFLTLAHQTFSQLSERLQGALQNSMPIYFRLGFDDAVWSAPRIGYADPYHKKHEVKAIGNKELPIEHHPAYFRMEEEYEEWRRKIEGLWPQQCFIKYNRNIPRLLRRFFRNTRTLKVRTVTLPPKKCTEKQINDLKDRYAQMLMKPKETIEENTQEMKPVSQEPTRKRRLQIG